MRRPAAVALLLAVSASPAFAQREPQIVIPGRPDVPVIINGIDASWGIVEGEFGLDRPGAMAPVVIYRPLEIVPPPGAPKPPPAPSYFRSWSSQSAPGPVTDYAPYPAPPIVYAPNIDVDPNRRGPHHHH